MVLNNALYAHITGVVKTALEKAWPVLSVSPERIYRSLSETPNIKFGHFAFACFPFAKEVNESPTEMARTLERHIPQGEFSQVKVMGPYINFFLDPKDYYEKVVSPIHDSSFFQGPFVEDNPKTMIEYSQPNTHKSLHVGHMRNLCLGNALVRMHRYLGRDILAVTYPGDMGMHVAKCLWYMVHHNKEAPPATGKGAWLGQLYATAHEKLEREQGGPQERENREQLSRILKELHDQKGEFFELWKQTRPWSLELMEEAYRWAGVDFDHWFFESEMDVPSVKLARELLSRGILREDDGAVVMDLRDKGLGLCLLIKSDGSGLYATKDIFLAQKKFQDFHIKKNIYIVDHRQALHFKQVFGVLEKMGFEEEAKHCHHLQYDVVELPEGPMSSRVGNIVPLMELVHRMEEKITQDYLNKYRETWSDQERIETARMVAGGAIKYGMVRMDNNKKIIFDQDEWLRLDGDTGPYLQYVHARIVSLCRKLRFDVSQKPDFGALSLDQELILLVKISLFNTVLTKAVEEFKPSLVCSYLFKLGKLFNNFYASCPIATAETQSLMLARLHLAHAVGVIMKKGLSVLGIESPEKM